jgi:hypothetical protein
MAKATAKIVEPDNLEVDLTLRMTLRDWKKLAQGIAQLEPNATSKLVVGEWPFYFLLDLIGKVAGDIEGKAEREQNYEPAGGRASLVVMKETIAPEIEGKMND